MLRTILDARSLVAMLIAAGVGAWGLHVYPVQSDDVFLALIELRKPALFQVLAYGYATLWFTTPFFLASLLTSVLAIAVYRHAPTARCRDLPPYPEPETREHPSLVLGETHRLTTPGRAAEPTWLTIPQRGLYTGIMILGAVGILLRRITDGYTTLAEVYRYVLQDTQIEQDIRRLQSTLTEPPESILIPNAEYRLHCLHAPWVHWFPEGPESMAHPYDSELETFLASRRVPYRVEKPQGTGWRNRLHQLEAVERWYRHGWSKLDARLRSSITEGVVVFLSLFDHDPAVQAAFCPPRSAYAGMLKPGDPTPLPPIEELLETGHVLALNFPVAMNPGLARALGVLLKLDFQRAVLQRIPQMAAQPARVWRDLLFVCDEYHAFATVGETDPSGDERVAFALSRQARLIPIVASQSISSLRSALHGDKTWRTLMQCFRTKLFPATSDEFTARTEADLCGRRDRLKAQYTLSEGGQCAHISQPLLGRHGTRMCHVAHHVTSGAFSICSG